MNIPGVSRPDFSRRSEDPQKASKHHQIDPSLPLKQRAVSALHKCTLTDCLHQQRAASDAASDADCWPH